MRKQTLVCIFLAVAALLGCRGREPMPAPGVRLVKQIVVTCEDGADFTRRFYNTDEKMRYILHFVRSMGIQDTPDTDPETVHARTICISITFSDGSQKLYRQKGDRYFQEGTGPWREISPEKVSGLYQAILTTPSDPEEGRLFRNPHTLLPAIRSKMPW